MKRKFSINPIPIMKRSMSKADLNSAKEVPQSPAIQMAAPEEDEEHDVKKDVCDFSEFISRRALSVQMDRELREACGFILKNFKPSDHGLEDTDPKLDFGATSRRAAGRKTTVAQVHVRKPSGAPEDMKDSYEKGRASTGWELAAKMQPTEPAQPNTSRRRADSNKSRDSLGWLDERDEKRYSRSKEASTVRLSMSRTQMNLDAMAASRTNSTSGRSNFTSTAPTSAAPTSGLSSNRRSRQIDNSVVIADAYDVERMRQELDKRRGSSAAELAHPPSRAHSVKNLSRSASRESLQRADTHMSPEKGAGLSNVGKDWGIPQRSNSRSSIGPSTSKVTANEETSPAKSGVKPSKQPPTLPSLDTWREPDWSPQEEDTVPLSPTAISRRHKRGGSDMSHSSEGHPHSPTFVRPGSEHSRTMMPAPRVPRKINTGAAQGHLNLMMGEWSSPTTAKFENPHKSSISYPGRHASSSVVPPISNASSQQPTYSRNVSLGASQQQKPAPQEEQKSRLRRAISGWMLKKERKDDWGHRQSDARESVAMQQVSGATPVARY